MLVKKPRVLREGHYSYGASSSCNPPGPTSSNYDVTPDGQRFIVIQDSDQDAAPGEVNVVLHWSEELKRLAPAKKSGWHRTPAGGSAASLFYHAER